ncbi:o-succinylbenzoate synthase [Oceanobacillus sp. 1P07AA]|uniref:o-succinylbenzoate synthase n=1 Tax=Oceanobacillus sp. 1P07AA TaxID=3132293 RepID=UPI0039A6E281
MKFQEITMHKVSMRMKNPFTTSFGTEQDRSFVIIEATDELGNIGWGECVTSDSPLYIEEFTDGSWVMLEQFLVPLALQHEWEHPDELAELFAPFKRNNLAKAVIDAAAWDIYTKRQGISLADALGGTKKEIEVGVSLGIEEDMEKLLMNIKEKVDEGYKRIKVKIKPGKDVEVVKEIREYYPDIPLMVDANSAYTLDDIDLLKQLDPYNLMMIEQPLTAGDLIDHAELQKHLETPICLDESIHSYDDARKAIQLGSGKIINMKVGRVGGLSIMKKIHDLCEEAEIPMWCGGMLESGIGRAHNIAVTSLANFTLPGDTAASSRYWQEDIIDPEVFVHDGIVQVPSDPGIGYNVSREKLAKYTVQKKTFNSN